MRLEFKIHYFSIYMFRGASLLPQNDIYTNIYIYVPIDEIIDISIKKHLGRKKKYNGFLENNLKNY